MAAAEQHLGKNDHALSVVMQALLALLSHGIDGNFVEPMKEAKALYERCPRLLKEKVKAILIKSGFEEITQ